MSERTVFVSYSRKDIEHVQHAVSLLEAGGAHVFRDLDDIKFGDRWETVIREKLAEAERVLVFWSEHAKASEWVTKEWEIAVDLGKRLVPVLLDETPMPPALGQFHALTNFMQEARPKPVKALNPKMKYTVLGVGALSAGVMATILFVPFSQHKPDALPAPSVERQAGAQVPTISAAEPRPAPAPPPAKIPDSHVPAEPSVIVSPPEEPAVIVDEPVAAGSSNDAEVLTEKERQQLGGLAMGTMLVGFAILMYWFKRRRQRAVKSSSSAAAPKRYDSPDEFVAQVFTDYK